MIRPLLIILCSLLIHMESTKAQMKAKIVRIDSCNYTLIATLYTGEGDSTVTCRRLPYKVFKIRQADINGDGKDDIVVEAEKKTVLDATVRRRLNIWQIQNNRIVPLWLSSFLPHPLYDFEIKPCDNGNHVVTIEYEEDQRFLVAEYKWHSFGLKLVHYIGRELPLENALSVLKTMLIVHP